MANSTLDAIRTKVRRLTRSLSQAQLLDSQIDEYVDTAMLLDFPEHLRLFNLRKTFDFYTDPYVDVYETNTTPGSVFNDFINKYTTIHPPVYVAGYQVAFLESREKLFGLYPKLNLIQSTGSLGNAVQTAFTGTIPSMQGAGTSVVLTRKEVLFDSIDLNGNGLSMIDYPINATQGNLYVPGGAPTSTTVLDVNNNINYTTGVYVVTFPTAPGNGKVINSQTVPVQTARPLAVCFFDGQFIMRPIPDQPYKVNMEVQTRPTRLLAWNQSPELHEWWQYIAYLAAKKVFEDRMDLDSVQMIMPELKKQEMLIQRRTIVQQTSQRTATIYTSDSDVGGYGPGFLNGGGSF